MSVLTQVQGLVAQGRAGEALKLVEPLSARPDAAAEVLQAHAAALKAVDRMDEAAALNRRAVERAPNDRIAWHNLAATLGDASDYAGSEEAARRAIALGLDAPETRLVLGRALQGQGRFDEAEAVFRDALKRRPAYADAHRDLAQLIWMRTGDAPAALKTLEQAIESDPQPGLYAMKALVLDRAGLTERALATAREGLMRRPRDVGLMLSASQYAGDLGEAEAALGWMEQALPLAPGHPALVSQTLVALMGVGRAQEAFDIAGQRLAGAPHDQMTLAHRATAARLIGHPDYERLYDYAAFVRPAKIDTPKGWPSLAAYLADLKASLDRLHALTAHPLENSLRGGSQTSENLKTAKDPAIRAFFGAIDRPIRDYMAAVGTGPGPLRARNTGAYTVRGIWSVKLKSGGRHVDHVHPQGWLSSAFYVETPDEALETVGREGWIRFGRPRHRTRPALDAGKYVRPEPGTLVLFPSYMWHGTVPFTTAETRMTVAFDVVPA